jgi:hypothetical protein
MRHGIQNPQRLDELPSIISFITGHGNAMPAGKVPNQALCVVPLGGAGSRSEAGSDDQAVAVLHQHMPHETELGLLAFALAEKPRLRVGGGSVGLDQTPFIMKIHYRVATAAALGRRGVLGAKTLQGGQASMRVPSTVKGSSDSSPVVAACSLMRPKKAAARSEPRKRS